MTQHTLFALTAQAVIYCALGDLWIGAWAASAYFFGREYAQAEQRVIQKYYCNRRAYAPLWCGLQPRAWTLKGLFDWIIPACVVFSVATVCHFGRLPSVHRSDFVKEWTPKVNSQN
jgi:hypothetical protein